MKNKRRVFLSLLIIAGISVLAYVATSAFFTARRTQAGNKFTMGTLDLQVGVTPQAEPFVVSNIGEDGTITNQKIWKVKNTGTLPGRMFVRLRKLVNIENNCNDQERVAEPSCTPSTTEGGEMGSKLTTGLYFKDTVATDVSAMTQVGTNHTLATADMDTYGADWNAFTPVIIPAGGEKYFGIKWYAGPNDYGNEIQDDSLEFEIEANLVQSTNAQGETTFPTPTNTAGGENTTGL